MSNTVSGKAIKATIVLNSADVALVKTQNGQSRVVLRINVGERTVMADVSAKSVRKIQATMADAGVENTACIVQGKLEGDRLTDAGLVAQVKAPASQPLANLEN